MIFFTSDLHAYHKNICRGTSNWGEKDINCRDFDTIEEMNAAIIESINSRVGKDDTLYHLGDWSFGGWENIWNFRKQIICENIIQINGNHDEHIQKNKFFPQLINNDGVISEIDNKSEYRSLGKLKNFKDVTAKDFFKSVHNNLRIVIDGQEIVLDHFPYEQWLNMNTGTWHLHGHVHHKLDSSNDNMFNKRKDVGWNGKIYSFDEIKEEFSSRENKRHH